LQVLAKSGATVAKAGGMSADATGKFIADSTSPVVEALEDSGGALAVDTLIRARVL
jgi:hypothetical protein